MKRAILIVLLLLIAYPIQAQSTLASRELTYIEIILDSSDSMKRTLGDSRKLDTARKAVINFINSSPTNYRFALRVMGGEASATKYNSKLLAGMGLMSNYTLVEMLQGLEPAGERALYHAISECLYDFVVDKGNNIAIVVTDGADEGERPIDGLKDLYKYSESAPKVYFVGLDLTDKAKDEFKAFTASSGGRVYNLDDPEDIASTLKNLEVELEGNLSVFVYDESGKEVTADIIVYDLARNPVAATYGATSLVKQLPEGTYTVEAKYRNQTLKSTVIDLTNKSSETINLRFAEKTGYLRLRLYDLNEGILRGHIKVTDMNYQVVYEGGPKTEFDVSLPVGLYNVEALVGTATHNEYGLNVIEGQTVYIDLIVPVSQAILEIEVNNLQSTPINAKISVMASDGFVMGEVEGSTSYYLTVPPDTYSVTVEIGKIHQEQTITLYEGDWQTLNFDIDVPVGYLLVDLRTDSGHDAWGTVRVYDSNGKQISRHWSIETDESPEWAFELPEGTYRIEAEVEGIVSTRDNVQVTGNQETRVILRFPDSVR